MENIELKDFISNTLIEIAQGVKDANGKLMNPDEQKWEVFSLRSNIGDGEKIPGIAFDIAITASKNQQGKAGFMVALAAMGGGVKAEVGGSDESVHRIKFEVGINSDWK